MARSHVRAVVGAGVAVVLLIGACDDGDTSGKGNTTTTRKVIGPTTTTVQRPDPETPLGMFCGVFEGYLAQAAAPPPESTSELADNVAAGRKVLNEIVERAPGEIAADAKVLRDGSVAYWDELAEADYDARKVPDAAKLAYLESTASARTNLERFGTGTCGIVTTTTEKKDKKD